MAIYYFYFTSPRCWAWRQNQGDENGKSNHVTVATPPSLLPSNRAPDDALLACAALGHTAFSLEAEKSDPNPAHHDFVRVAAVQLAKSPFSDRHSFHDIKHLSASSQASSCRPRSFSTPRRSPEYVLFSSKFPEQRCVVCMLTCLLEEG